MGKSLDLLGALVEEGSEESIEAILSDDGIAAKAKRRLVAARRRTAASAAKELLRHHREVAKAGTPQEAAGSQHLHLHGQGGLSREDVMAMLKAKGPDTVAGYIPERAGDDE